MMAEMVRGLEDFIYFYLDDFIIFSATIDEHVQHVQRLLERLDAYGMHIQPEKCHFCEREVKFLGYQISREGILPLQDNVAAIQELNPPSNLQELRRFLGMVNYYHNFIPEVARLLAPLHELLKGDRRPKKRKLDWKEEHQVAFTQAKQALVKVAHLAFDDPEQTLILTTDGSGTHCGGVLEVPIQKGVETVTQPLAFFSKPFSPTTRTRSAFNRELSALYLSVKHFKNCLRGRDILVRTDHKALVNAINNGRGEHSLNEQRMINYIKEYGPSMQHIPGKENPVADSLSRPNLNSIVDCDTNSWEIPTIEDFALYQEEDPTMPGELEQIQRKRNLRLVTRSAGENRLYGVVEVDSPNSRFRPVVPRILQSAIFHVFHDTLHQGVEKSLDIVRRHYFWCGMIGDIEKWVKYCPKFQSCKVSRHNRQTLENFPGSPKRFETLHLDIVGPLSPVVDEYQYLLTIRDRNTGFSRLLPLVNKSSSSVVGAFKSNWIEIFSVPETVVTDNGREFVSEAFETICENLGIRHVRTTTYHPQSNGFIERIHRTVKTALRCLDDKEQWVEQMPWISLMLNNQVADTNGYTPYQKTFGKVGKVPGVLLVREDASEESNLSNEDMQLFCEMMSHHGRYARPLDVHTGYVDKNLMEANHVWVRKEGIRPSLDALYEGPYPVVQKFRKYFIIRSWEGQQKISVDRLKTAYLAMEEESSDFGIVGGEAGITESFRLDVDQHCDEPTVVEDEVGPSVISNGTSTRTRKVRAPEKLDL